MSSPKPDPKSEYSLSNGHARAVLDVPQWTSLARVAERSADSMLRTRSSRTSRGELMSVVQPSHIEPGAGCSVDVGLGSAGRGGSAEAENMGADVDDGAASTLVLSGQNDCSKVSWKIATSIGTPRERDHV